MIPASIRVIDVFHRARVVIDHINPFETETHKPVFDERLNIEMQSIVLALSLIHI